jgi:mannose-1-phosphate guanylyltransferase
MLQVNWLNLQIAENWHDLGDWNRLVWFKDVKQTRNVLLDVKLDLKRLKRQIFDPPDISHVFVRNLLELFHLV